MRSNNTDETLSSPTREIVEESRRLDRARSYMHDILMKRNGVNITISQSSMYAIWEDLNKIMKPACPESESSFAIKTEACDLRRTSLTEYLENPIAQYVECDPNGTKQHEMGAKLDAHKAKSGVLGDFGRALMAVSEVGTFGIKKYARGSWQHVPNGVERYTDALWRHLLQENKESTDPDSGLPHEFHVAWNALARLELLLREREVNINLHTTDKATEET